MSTTLQQAEALLVSMTFDEKSLLLDRVARELSTGFPGIDRDPNVCGGDARIVRTRIPIWVLEQARRLGASDAELLASYPSLRLADLSTAWAYVRTHMEEIDRTIRENEEA